MTTMRRNVLLTSVAFAVYVTIAAPAIAQTSDTSAVIPASAAATTSAAQPGEIVVTAERRETKLIDTPISLSVLGGKQLDESSSTGLTQILNSVPGVSATVDYQSGGTQLAIRGVSAAGPTFDGSGTVAYYLDGLPFGFIRSANGPDLNPYDLSRVEVLRGPQGTLYGAGGLNGVVRVLTADPDLSEFDLKGRMDVSGTYQGGTNIGGDGEINVPIIKDALAIRVVVGDHHYAGWIDSLDKNDVNDGHVQTYRVKVAAKPFDNFTAQFSFWRNANSYGAPSDANDKYFNDAALPDPVKNSYNDFGLKLSYDGPGFTITSDTGYLKYQSNALTDLHPVGLPTGFQGETDFRSRSYTEELDIASNTASRFIWSGGLFYRDARDVNYQPFNTPGAQLIYDNFADGSRSAAIFGEIGYKFTDTLQLTGGLRYFHDDSRSQALSASALGPVSLLPYKANFNAVTPRVVLQYHPDAKHNFYVSYSQGFRSGLVQDEEVTVISPDVPPAKPDRLSNYEAGAKGSIGDLVDYTAAVFYIDWKKVQQVVETPVGNGTYVGAIVNGASASGVGAEGSLFFHVAHQLRIGGTFSYSGLTLDKNVFSSGVLLFDKGQRLAFSPKYTAGASADWTFPLGTSGDTAVLSTSANYTSRQTQVTLRGAGRVISYGDNIFKLNSRFALNSANHKWTAAIFGNNLTNNNGTPLRSPSTDYFDIRTQPRTVGLQLEFHY